MPQDYDSHDAKTYAKHGIQGTLTLAYREFPHLFETYVDKTKVALDYGCGAGRSTRYLRDMGFNVDGVDISDQMLSEAVQTDSDHIEYTKIESGIIDKRKSKYDLVFSTLVLLEVPTIEEMQKILDDIYRVSKFNGTIIILTVADDFYEHDWVSVSTQLPENQNLESGKSVFIELKEINNLRLQDYYWIHTDYRQVFERSGFNVVEIAQPKADQDDEQEWLSEKDHAPYSIYVLKKRVALENAQKLIQDKQLLPFADRGYFHEIEKSEILIAQQDLPDGYNGDRLAYSKIEFLMTAGQKWPLHKTLSNETFRHIEGCDVTLHLIHSNGRIETVYLGEEHDDAVQEYTIPGNTWFAEEVDTNGGYALMEVTTAPGFHR